MSEIHRIGIVGDGQLGRMLTEAALPPGYEVTVPGETIEDAKARALTVRDSIDV